VNHIEYFSGISNSAYPFKILILQALFESQITIDPTFV
jgi:hypothetical protein